MLDFFDIKNFALTVKPCDFKSFNFLFTNYKDIIISMNIWQKLVLLLVLIACLFEEVVSAKKQAKKPV